MPKAIRLLNTVMQNKGSLGNTDDGKCTCQNKAYNKHVQKVVGVLAYFYHTTQHHMGACSGAVGRGTALQVGRSWV